MASTNDNYYFTKDTQNAIIEYNESEDPAERSRIFRERIDGPLQQLCEVIVNMNKFSHFEGSKADFVTRIKTHLVENLWRFDESKGKAFSYFSYIARNKGIELDNKTYNRWKSTVDIDDEEVMLQLESAAQAPIRSELEEFIELFIQHWEARIYHVFDQKRDVRIAEAILDIFRKRHGIDCLSRKRVLYQMIRESAGVTKAQHITKVKNVMQDHYYEAIRRFRNTGSIEPEEEGAFF